MARLDIRMLGPLEVRRGRRTLDLGTRKQRAVFALLVANRCRTVSADRMIESLWEGAGADNRRKDVWVYMSRLRKALAPIGDVIRSDGAGYTLEVGDEAIDACRFEALVERARDLLETDPGQASSVLAEALGEWSGEAFGEFSSEDFVAAEAARLEESRLSAIEMRLEAELATGDAGALIPEIRGLLVDYPLRSRLVAGLMLALHRQGQQADALIVYAEFARRLAEMGLQPPIYMGALEQQILVDDSVFVATAPRAGSGGFIQVQ